ncbi:MAG: hypothetical protein HC809_15390, partial [Gammaproteobacteria bacterium]|nr:hypothetical protein [Gammaproteobacteria bacterium]
EGGMVAAAPTETPPDQLPSVARNSTALAGEADLLAELAMEQLVAAMAGNAR